MAREVSLCGAIPLCIAILLCGAFPLESSGKAYKILMESVQAASQKSRR